MKIQYFVDYETGDNLNDGILVERGGTGPWKTIKGFNDNKTAGIDIVSQVNAGHQIVLSFKGYSVDRHISNAGLYGTGDFADAFQKDQVHLFHSNSLALDGLNPGNSAHRFIVNSYGEGKAILCQLGDNITSGDDVAVGAGYECDFDGPDPSVARVGSGVWRYPYTGTVVNRLYEDGRVLKRAYSISDIGVSGDCYWERDQSPWPLARPSIALYYKPTSGDPLNHMFDRNATPTGVNILNCSNILIEDLWFQAVSFDSNESEGPASQDLDNITIRECWFGNCTPVIKLRSGSGFDAKNIHTYKNFITGFDNNGISYETDASGSERFIDSSIHSNVLVDCDANNVYSSYMGSGESLGFGDYRGIWSSSSTYTKGECVGFLDPYTNDSTQFNWYFNISGSNGVTDPQNDSGNWAQIPLKDNEGIVIQNPVRVKIYNNDVSLGFAGGAIVVWTEQTPGLANNLRIYNNNLHDLEGPGIACGTGSTDLTLTETYIYCNTISNHRPDPDGWEDSSGAGDGLRLNGNDSSDSLYCLNNTLHNLRVGVDLHSVSSGWNIEGNIISECSDYYVKRYEPNGMVSSIKRNIYWNSSDNYVFYLDAVKYNSFEDWKTALRASSFSGALTQEEESFVSNDRVLDSVLLTPVIEIPAMNLKSFWGTSPREVDMLGHAMPDIGIRAGSVQ